MKKHKCPCKECISYAMCVNTSGSGCELTDKYIRISYKDFQKKREEVKKCLKMDYCFVVRGKTRFYHNRDPKYYNNGVEL